MKFTIQKDVFVNQAADVSRAIQSKATIAILTGIKITATNSGIYLTGSDAEISIESFLDQTNDLYDLNIEETGSIVVTASLFNNIIRKLPDNIIQFESNEDNSVLTITSGPAVFDLKGQDGSQYPHLPEFDETNQIPLPTKLFKELIDRTIFSASNQENRPYLTGLNLTVNPTHIIGVATDSHRLSRRIIPVQIDESVIDFESFTVPKKTVTELSRIAEDDQDLFMVVSSKQVIFLMENTIIYSRLLEGNYPDTNRLIPTSSSTEIILNSDILHQALDRASLMSHQGKNNVVLLNVVDNAVELTVSGNERGQAFEAIKTKEVTGDDLQISFNPDYMKEALRSFNGVDVRIQFQSAVHPMLISSEAPSEVPHNELLQLLTPIRTHHTY